MAWTRRRLRGFAIIATLVLVAVLSLFALEFGRRSSIGLRLALNEAQAKQALYSALGGYETALQVLLLDDNEYDGPGDPWSQQIPPIPFGEGSVQVFIHDEQSRLNLTELVTDYGEQDERTAAMLSRLFELLAIDRSVVYAMVDWQDQDELPLPGGGEAAAYVAGNPPYAPSNSRFLTLGESLLVRGFDRGLLFSPPSSRSLMADDSFKPAVDYLTVYGDGRINVNTAPVPVLLTLSRDISRSTVQDIVDRREVNPFENLAELKELNSVSDVLFDEIDSLLTVKSDTFRIRAVGLVGELSRSVEAVVRREGKRFRVVYFNRSL
jgi:general secretion pathway protein K